MSDLLISYDSLTVPPDACRETPPEATTRVPHPTDGCFIDLGLVDDTNPSATPRMIRFDRAGDHFVLSSANSTAVRDWFESHTDTMAVYDTLRLSGAMLRGYPVSLSAPNLRVLFVISQFISTGMVRTSPRGEVTLDRSEMASGLLEIFTDSGEGVLRPILGQLQVARRSAWLSEEGVERIRWVTSLLDLVPSYRLMRSNFVAEEEIENWDDLPEERIERLADITFFLRSVVTAEAAGEPLRFSQNFLRANDAYQELYGEDIAAGRRSEFCVVLTQALQTLRGERGTPALFLSECRDALRLRDLSPEVALRDSLRSSLLGPANLREMQEAIETESLEANMTVEWLMERGDAEHGRIGEVLEVFFQNFQVTYPDDAEAAPILGLNIPGLRAGLTTLIDAHSMNRREYLLAALAVLRSLLGSEGDPELVRVFVRDEFEEVAWSFSGEELTQLRRFLEGVEASRESSQEATDIWLPMMEGVVCAVGIGGLFATELVPELRGDEGLHLGLGATSAGLAGAGCSSLAGHFFWPEIGEVRNRYLWEGLTGIGGAVVGVGIYLLVQLLSPGSTMPMPMPGMRFPIDEYGP